MFTIITSSGFIPIPFGKTIVVGDEQINYETLMLFSANELNQRGISIQDDPIPAPAPVSDTISYRQFYTMAAIANLITKDEAKAAIGTGAIPPEMMNVVNNIVDPTVKFIAECKIIGAVEFNINDSLVQQYAASQNPPWTLEQLISFWDQAFQL